MFVTISFMCLVFSVMVAPSFAQTPWSTEIVDSNIGGSGSSLALDSANNPHISYLTYDNSLKYAWRDSSGWHSQTVQANSWDPSLALDSTGTPHISYISWPSENPSHTDLIYASAKASPFVVPESPFGAAVLLISAFASFASYSSFKHFRTKSKASY